jgi:amidase
VKTADELCVKSARELRALIDARELSCVELLTATLDRIERVNPSINAIVTLVPEQAMAAATAADAALARGDAPGLLHGLPIAIKDLVATKGIRTTMGSPLFADNVPDTDQLFVQRLRAAGAIVIGKTNTPEFGAGSQTFNTVFGATRNPYDRSKTPGGSSGGAAAALAARLLPIADGSDLGGSLRNPASFCNVVGLRPTAGRVPAYPAAQGWGNMSVMGPMGRSVADVALLLSAMAGPDSRSPISLEEPGTRFMEPLERDLRGLRVAWSPDLGELPVDARVIEVCESARGVFEGLGAAVEEAHPDLSDAMDIFHALRAGVFATSFAHHYEHLRDQLKDTVIWNVEQGRKLTAVDVGRAEAARTKLYYRMQEFFEHYDALILPVAQTVPFPVEQEWVEEINGVQFANYLEWMRSCAMITVTGSPAISVPCGFTAEGLPVGLQIVGRPRDDFELLQVAHAFEQATRHGERAPTL